MLSRLSLSLLFVASQVTVNAFAPLLITKSATRVQLQLHNSINDNEVTSSRRNALRTILTSSSTAAAALITASSSAVAVDDDLTRGGVPLTPFNGLAFQYRGGVKGTGLDASTLDEDSISYADFLKYLDEGKVTFVEFLAPNGDKAYATVKMGSATSSDGETSSDASTRIRIGEGYPIEDPEGWSSPAFVVKSVFKKGVPYKFILPALDKYK